MGHSSAEVNIQDPGKLVVSPKTKTLYSALMFIGLVCFIITVITDQERAWHAYLIGFFFTISLALGGLFLTALQHVTNAGWSVNIRRIFESMSSFLGIGFVLGIVLMLFGIKHLYPWLDPEIVAKDALLQHKAPYLNGTFFWIRFVGFFFVWLLYKKIMVGSSLKQDETGDVSITKRMVPVSITFLLAFALSYSLFSIDTLMALEPHWFSTIFGVYTFAGLFQTSIAVTILVIGHLQKKGMIKGLVTNDHLHDLGKFLFAFTVFWAYIAFSQFMLIWYANLPEETIFYIPRSHGSWGLVSVLLILFKFIVPFMALLPKWAKRNISHLSAVSILILVMQFVDLYWLVYPTYSHDGVVLGFQEVGVFLGFVGVFIFTLTNFLSKHPVVPFKDPRVQESVHHHVVY